MRTTLGALGWSDVLVIGVGAVLFVLHFTLTGFPSHILSPWLIASILAGWVFARIALDRIERS